MRLLGWQGVAGAALGQDSVGAARPRRAKMALHLRIRCPPHRLASANEQSSWPIAGPDVLRRPGRDNLCLCKTNGPLDSASVRPTLEQAAWEVMELSPETARSTLRTPGKSPHATATWLAPSSVCALPASRRHRRWGTSGRSATSERPATSGSMSHAPLQSALRGADGGAGALRRRSWTVPRQQGRQRHALGRFGATGCRFVCRGSREPKAPADPF